jgi:hypothetical protein
MSTLATPESRDMDPISRKDVFPTTGTTYDIAAIRLHKDIGWRGSLHIIERRAYRSSFTLSGSSMVRSAGACLFG